MSPTPARRHRSSDARGTIYYLLLPVGTVHPMPEALHCGETLSIRGCVKELLLPLKRVLVGAAGQQRGYHLTQTAEGGRGGGGGGMWFSFKVGGGREVA